LCRFIQTFSFKGNKIFNKIIKDTNYLFHSDLNLLESTIFRNNHEVRNYPKQIRIYL